MYLKYTCLTCSWSVLTGVLEMSCEMTSLPKCQHSPDASRRSPLPRRSAVGQAAALDLLGQSNFLKPWCCLSIPAWLNVSSALC